MGKLDPSGSPWINCLPLNSDSVPPSEVGERKLSCFSAVAPVSGIENVGVVGRALFHRPVFHRRSDNVGDGGIELFARIRSS